MTLHWIVGQWLLQWLEHLADLDVLNLGQMVSIVGQSMAVKCWLCCARMVPTTADTQRVFPQGRWKMALLGRWWLDSSSGGASTILVVSHFLALLPFFLVVDGLSAGTLVELIVGNGQPPVYRTALARGGLPFVRWGSAPVLMVLGGGGMDAAVDYASWPSSSSLPALADYWSSASSLATHSPRPRGAEDCGCLEMGTSSRR